MNTTPMQYAFASACAYPFVIALALLVAGCASPSASVQSSRPAAPSGGYYGGELPPESMQVDPDSVADAVVRREPLSASGNRPYTALGKKYRPMKSARGHVERGVASWYGRKFHGRRTSSGERYDMFAMTAAHPTLPLPTYVRVTNLDNGKSVVVKVNDRGPFLHNRILDLSYVAAHKLDIARHGTGRVEVRALEPDANAPSANVAAQGDYAGGERIGDGVILIQVGAYAERDNARAMRRLLDEAGYPLAPLTRAQTSGATLYRVRVGPYASRAEARDQQRKLEAMLGRAVALVVEE
ncbi:MAG: septal ring lytic transglycosylase RlpA family protein [bacterium]